MQRVCEICGKEFASNRRQQFCSSECTKKAKVARNRKYKQTKRQECKINCLKICPIYEKEFTPRTSRQKYCSLKCQQKAQRVEKYRSDCSKEGFFTNRNKLIKELNKNYGNLGLKVDGYTIEEILMAGREELDIEQFNDLAEFADIEMFDYEEFFNHLKEI